MRERKPAPKELLGTIQPADVLSVVDFVIARLEKLKTLLAITEQSELPARDTTKTPTDVFLAIVQANRQLNLLVEKRFTPGDVFQQVTLGISYCSNLLAVFPDAKRLPDAPQFERRKTPSEVYRRLIDCYARIRDIAAKSNVKMLDLEISDREIQSAAPSEVYDVVSVIVSELAHLHSLHGSLRPPRRVFAPGPLFPSHVYQRAGILEAQLIRLEQLVAEKPDWLRD